MTRQLHQFAIWRKRFWKKL